MNIFLVIDIKHQFQRISVKKTDPNLESLNWEFPPKDFFMIGID